MDIKNLEESRGWIYSLLGWTPFVLSSLFPFIPEGGCLGIKEGAGSGQELRGGRQVLRLTLLTLRTRVGGVFVTGVRKQYNLPKTFVWSDWKKTNRFRKYDLERTMLRSREDQ